MAEPSPTVTHAVGAKITHCQNRAEQCATHETPAAATISGPCFQARRGGVTRNASAWFTKAQNDASSVSSATVRGLERTLFTLDWINDPDLRRATGQELNKEEAATPWRARC